MNCPDCGTEMQEGVLLCPSCGHRFEREQPPKKTRRWLWIPIVIAVLTILGIGLFFVLRGTGSGGDKNGVWVQVKMTEYKADGTIRSSSAIEFDEFGRQIGSSLFSESGTNIRYECKYDADGKHIKDLLYNAEDEYFGWREYQFDSLGRFSGYIQYDVDGNMVSVYEYESEKSSEHFYHADGSLAYSIIHEFDTYGNETKSLVILSDGTTSGSVYEYAYDGNGRIIHQTITELRRDGTPDHSREYEIRYESNGSVLKSIFYDAASGTVERWYESRFDEYDNLIKRTSYDSDGNVIGWTEYEWKYFENVSGIEK